jgi:Tfp pilus assembly protein PilX
MRSPAPKKSAPLLEGARSGDHGAALVVTLIVCTVLATVVVAMMQNTGLDRASSAAIANQYRATLAAEAGLAAAEATLARAMTNDTFIVVANTNRQLFVGNGSAGTANFSYTPAFSTSPNLTSAVAPIVTGGIPATNPPAGPNTTNFTFTNLPGGLSVTSPPAISWVYLTTTNPGGATVTNARFAYWVEDLGGRLDLSVVGTNTAGRPTGTNPAEIALWSVFNPGASNDFGNATADALIGARSNLVTTATARLASPNVDPADLADLSAGLIHDTNEPAVIPFGFGYSQEGNLKTNLNTANLNSIASIVSANLPSFSSRSGGLDANRYLRAIAANVVDYIDADSIPTTEGTPGGADYVQGVDSFPLINEVAVRYFANRPPTGNLLHVQRQPFVELWNPTDRDFSQEVEIVVTCNDSIIGALGSPVNFTATSTTNFIANVPAGSFRAFALPADEVSIEFGGPVTPPNNRRPGWGGTNEGGSFTLRVGGTLVQSNLGSLQRRASSVFGVSGDALRVDQFNHVIVRGQRATATGNLRLTGDPRAHIYRSGLRQSDRTGADYTWPTYTSHYGNESSFGGRNPLNSYTNLLEPLRPTAAGNSPGNNVTGIQTLPTAVTPVAPDTNNVLQRIRNAPMKSAVELGRIFDPGLWNLTGTANEVATTATAHPSRGGGFTLRIGQREHPLFDTDGQRASQLLDLLAASELPPGPGGAVRSGVAGRINVNTATTNALRALAAGVKNSADTGLTPGGTNFVVPVAAVSEFVTSVVAQRDTRPFYSTAQLSGLTNTNGVSVFGNTNLLAVNNWNDAAAEEWFARLYELSTARSRNFLVHVVGQAVRTNAPTDVLSTSRAAFQIYVEPLRGGNGLTTNAAVRAIQNWEL